MTDAIAQEIARHHFAGVRSSDQLTGCVDDNWGYAGATEHEWARHVAAAITAALSTPAPGVSGETRVLVAEALRLRHRECYGECCRTELTSRLRDADAVLAALAPGPDTARDGEVGWRPKSALQPWVAGSLAASIAERDAARRELGEAREELVDVIQPLVNYLVEHHAERYGGNHCIDVALDLLRELGEFKTTVERLAAEPATWDGYDSRDAGHVFSASSVLDLMDQFRGLLTTAGSEGALGDEGGTG